MARRDLCFKPATELAEDIANERLSPVEVVDAHLARIQDRNPTVNAYLTVLEDEARNRAQEAEQAIADGESIGPLHGVPIAVKDYMSFKQGVRHTFGSQAFADFVPEHDSLIVERLEAAGAIILGKTNTPEFARKGTTDNKLMAPTGNPFDPEKTSGGSSGGSAAAVADGMAAIAEGTDVAGSIRCPSSMCGVYGIKPSPGVIPEDFRPNAFLGHTPFNSGGPIARTVADAALLLSVLAGPDPRDPMCIPIPDMDFRAALDEPVDELSVAASPDLGLFNVTEAVEDLFETAVQRFDSLVADVDYCDPAFEHEFQQILDAYVVMLQGFSAAHDESFKEAFDVDVLGEHRDQITDRVVKRTEQAQELSAIEFLHTGAVRTSVFDAIQDVFSDYDLLITPVVAVPSFFKERNNPQETANLVAEGSLGWLLTWPFNMTGHPAASLPIGQTSEGLPVGLQIVGRRYDDPTILAASASYERSYPWHDMYETLP